MAYSETEFTYGESLKEICRMVGHPIPSDAAGSTDPAVQQMGVAINRGLAELLTKHDWQELTKEASISVVRDTPGQLEKGFNLPDDFDRFCDMTQWNNTSDLPATGPISNQAWMSYIVRATSPQLTLSWQLREKQLWVLAPPATAAEFKFMYISKGIVKDADVPTNTKNSASKNGDTFVIDDTLVMLLGRAKYLEWKGFDASAATRDFLMAFDAATSNNKGATILNIGRRGSSEPLLTGMANVPDTGYGS